MAAQIVTLGTEKYQLIPVEKGTKVPAGVSTIRWHDGKDYILSPIETKAPAKEESKTPVKEEPKAPAKEEHESPFVRIGKWIAGIGLAALILLVVIILISKVSDLVHVGQNPAASAPVSAPASVVLSEATVVDLGSIGSYHAVYDSNVGQWTLGIWETSMTRAGKGLSEFKLRATSVSFVMPADGIINNSADHIAINNVEWTPGNPAVDSNGSSLVAKGSNVTIWTDGPNDSAGFQIWFK